MLGLKKKSILNYYKKHIGNVDGHKAVQEQEKINTVLLIVEEKDRHLIDDFKKLSDFSNATINSIIICDYDKKRLYEAEEFTSNDLSLLGKIKNPDLQSVLDQKVDLLLTYNFEDTVAVNFFSLQSKAKFKVGCAAQDERLNHLVIAVEGNDLHAYHNELIKYLKILNKL